LGSASQQAQAAQQQIQAQRFQQYVQAEDSRFEASIASESAETKRAVNENGARILQQYYGVDARAFAQAAQNTPALRAAEVQRMLFDIIKTKVAEEGIKSKLDRSAPPVQRPGVSQPHGSNSDVDSLIKQFRSAPSVDNAVQLLMARRASNRR
jgi:hypothetical protein